ncbi:MAG: YraN family protein [Deltaproteobacteria bacterium]|nr:YraN family protein [Deltaproteobacteria bacterium]
MNTKNVGDLAEEAAEAALIRQGYEVIERNWRGGGAEVDRVAWHEGILVFLEIRSRADETSGDPAETVRWGKQRRVVRAAVAYLAEWQGRLPDVRFDVVSVVRGRRTKVLVFRDAFDAGVMGGAPMV